jgi:hypothetical protein
VFSKCGALGERGEELIVDDPKMEFSLKREEFALRPAILLAY